MSQNPTEESMREHVRLVRHTMTDERAEQMLTRIKASAKHEPQTPSRWKQIAAAAALLLGVLAAALWWAGSPPEPGQASSSPAVALTAPLTLPDGSQVLPQGPSAKIRLELANHQEVQVRMIQGSATFHVKKNPERLFVVKARQVEVTVRGTTFDVAYTPAGDVEVSVDEGHVSIHTDQGDTELFNGQRWSSKPVESAPVMPEADAEEQHEDPAALQAHPEPPPAPRKSGVLDWRTPAKAGDYAEAAERLRGVKLSRYEDIVLAVETMRMVDKPGDADRYLQRFVRGSPKDPRAHYARFARARLKMNELNQPLEAAKLLGQLRLSLPPTSPLHQDVAAREVEAYARGGQPARAAELARLYLERYPRGARLESVKRWGNMP